jgi:membrane protease YdiL (CAAX protease family)
LAIFEAGICEEIIFRGFLFERLGRILGDSSAARPAIVLISSIMFGAVHFNQGLAGIENATIGGVFSGALYLLNQRRLYLVMVAHAAFDLGSLALIYWNLETFVAHLFL